MKRFRIPAVLALLLLLVLAFPENASSSPVGDDPPLSPTVRPVRGPVVRSFEPPAFDWQPGHRGVDLAGRPGETVVAPAAGRVLFAGEVAGVPVVSIEHAGGLRTTFQPVSASVPAGEDVAAGEPIGVLEPGHCAGPAPGDGAGTPEACLHLGLKRDEEYLDPLMILNSASLPRARVRLLPASAADQVTERAAARRAEAPASGSGTGPGLPDASAGSTRPADGPITSRFGTRRHPITGVVKLHDGLDIGAACGSAIRSVLPGTVVRAEFHTAYGWWVIVDHGAGLRTGYAHARRWQVRAGDSVTAGQRLGEVGSTGYSTGCHLHFMAWSDGRIVNPVGLL